MLGPSSALQPPALDGAPVVPLPRPGAARAPTLTAEHVAAWRERGFLVVHATAGERDQAGQPGTVLTPSEVEAFRAAAKHVRLPNNANFGGVGFPFLNTPDEAKLNDLALHPRIASACRELLGADDLVLSQAELWTKLGQDPAAPKREVNGLPPEQQNADQRMHCDFPNHYLTVPPPFDAPEAVAMIVYFDDWRECGGRTAAVERQGPRDPAYAYPDALAHMPGVGDLPWINDRTAAEAYLSARAPDAFAFRQALYARERMVDFYPGTVLFYRLDVWHRGTPVDEGKSRVVMNLVLKKRGAAAHLTSWHPGFARQAYNAGVVPRPSPPEKGRFEAMVERLAREQRELLGFPLLRDTWWTRDTLRAVRARYPGMDLADVEEELRARL